jgi:uncharacterized protein YjbI with pentapeptide repeats
MKLVLVLLGSLSALGVATPVVAQEFYADFALVVQVPGYEAFLTNLGDTPIRVDGYEIRSPSGSLSLSGWESLDSAGPEIVDALGPGADQFDVIGGVTPQVLAELNLLGSATWQPGQSWSIGFPFDSTDPDFVLDPVFRFSSPDGFVLNGGTVVPEKELALATTVIVPEPSTIVLLVCAVGVVLVIRHCPRRRPLVVKAMVLFWTTTPTFARAVTLIGGSTNNGNLDRAHREEIFPGYLLPKPDVWVGEGLRSNSGPYNDAMSSEKWAGPAPTPVTTSGNGTPCGGPDCGVFFKPFTGNPYDGAATGHLYQDNPATPGSTYALTGWAGAEANAQMEDAQFALEFLNVANSVIGRSTLSLLPTLSVPNGNPFTYKEYMLIATAPAGTVSVRVRASMIGGMANPAGGGQAFVIDDFTLTDLPPAPFNILQWEYINPLDPSQGKQESDTLATDGYGLRAEPGLQATAKDLSNAFLIGADLTSTTFNSANLKRAALDQANLTNADFTGADLTGATLSDAILTDAIVKNAKFSSTLITRDQLYSTASYRAHDLTGVHFTGNDLSGVNLAGQNLASADFYAAELVGADFTNANLTEAEFITADLSQANLTGANLTDGSLALADLSGANLAGANLSGTNLVGTNFAGANIRGASLSRVLRTIYVPAPGEYLTPYTGKSGCYCSQGGFFPGSSSTTYYFVGTGINLGQLAATADYGAGDLSGAVLANNVFNGGNFAGFNLTGANFTGTTLVGADLSGADARGAFGLDGIAASNLIRPNGHIAGLNLSAGQVLAIRDYDGNGSSGPIPITVDQQLAMALGGTLRMLLEADAWDSTISFAAAVPVTLGGTLELDFTPGVNLFSQIGRTFVLFDWTGVNPTGAFAIASPYAWDVSNLYTTGEVTLISIPEPTTSFLMSVWLVAAWVTRRTRHAHTVTPRLTSVCRVVFVLALLGFRDNGCLADPPEIQVTRIGAPTWKPVDFQLFSAPAAPFDQEFGQVYRTLLPHDSQPAASYTPHAPPYDTEFSAGMIAGGYVSQSVFTADAITLDPNGVYFAFMLVPDPGITGSSRDFVSGSVIPNSLFPLAANADAWLDGVLVDRLPGIDAVIPVQPKDVGFQGTSHLEALMAIWHPWDDDLTVGPLGNYDLRFSIRDVGGGGWDIVAPFQVVPELPGDFNSDGAVDAADYVVWRKTGGAPEDYNTWRAHFGQTTGSGSVAGVNAAVPEPTTLALLMLAVAGWYLRPGRTR